MKRRSIDKLATAEIQAALKKTLDLFDSDAKDLLHFSSTMNTEYLSTSRRTYP
jgi:hypothetical protein